MSQALSAPVEATVDRILDTAAALFWEKGYAATTTREIAGAVGIQQASLYHHMASKEDLLYQICLTSLQEFLTEVKSAVNQIDGAMERIRVLIGAHLTTLLRHQKRNVTMLTELRSLSRPHRIEVLALRENYARFVRSAFEEGQAAGTIRDDVPAKYLCLALLNILNWVLLWFREGQPLSAQQLAAVFVKIFLEGAAPAGARPQLALPEFSGKSTKPGPRARKSPKTGDNATVERLVDAAVALFSRKGYAATSTREVAALLGIQKASLYYHIEGKEDLLYAICTSSLTRIRSDVEAATRSVSNPIERIRAMISAHIESMLRDAEEHATTLAELHALSPEKLAHVLALRSAYEGLIRSLLQEAQAAGVLRLDIDAKYLCLSVLGLMNRVLVWYERGGPLTPGQLGQLLGVIFLTGAAVDSPRR